eukprot:6679292-Prymnesium_polylepis.1
MCGSAIPTCGTSGLSAKTSEQQASHIHAHEKPGTTSDIAESVRKPRCQTCGLWPMMRPGAVSGATRAL